MKKNNFDESKETILTMFNQSAADPTAVNEVIEEIQCALVDE